MPSAYRDQSAPSRAKSLNQKYHFLLQELHPDKLHMSTIQEDNAELIL